MALLALSVRQPWAWAIIHAGKDIENRSRFAITKGRLGHFSRVAVHAAKGMTRDEYEGARDFMRGLGVDAPPPAELLRGGIIGEVDITGVVKPKAPPASRWYMGDYGLRLANAAACEFIPCVGHLGLFGWLRIDDGQAAPALPWMLKWGVTPSKAAPLPDLFA